MHDAATSATSPFASSNKGKAVTSILTNTKPSSSSSSLAVATGGGASGTNGATTNNNSIVELDLLPGPRATVYLRLDRGFLLLYESEEVANTPRARQRLGHGALLVLSLNKQRLSVRHKKIVRMRNYMSKFTLRAARLHPPHLPTTTTPSSSSSSASNTTGPHANSTASDVKSKRLHTAPASSSSSSSSSTSSSSQTHRRIDIVRELFVRSAGGATDAEVRTLATRLQEHIHYADAQLTLTRLGTLDDAQILDYALRHVGAGGTTTDVHVLDCDVTVTLPLPDATSDDDSDLEDIPLRSGIIERFFRIVRPPPAALFEKKEEDLLHAWKEQLVAQYEVFPGRANLGTVVHRSAAVTDSPSTSSSSMAFPCTIVIFSEAKLMCVFHEMTLFSVLSLRRCLEKVMTKRDRLSTSSSSTTTGGAYHASMPRHSRLLGRSMGKLAAGVGVGVGIGSDASGLGSSLPGAAAASKAVVVHSALYELDSSSDDDDDSDAEAENSDRDYDFEPDPILLLAQQQQQQLTSTTGFKSLFHNAHTSSTTMAGSAKRKRTNQEDGGDDDDHHDDEFKHHHGPEEHDHGRHVDADRESVPPQTEDHQLNGIHDINNNNNDDSEDEHLGLRQRRARHRRARYERFGADYDDDPTDHRRTHDEENDEDSDEEAEQEVLTTLLLLQHQLQQRRHATMTPSLPSSSSSSTTPASWLPKIKQYFIELLAYDRRTYRFQFTGKQDYHLWLEVVQPHLRQAPLMHHGNQTLSTFIPAHVASNRRGGPGTNGKESALSRAEYTSAMGGGGVGGGVGSPSRNAPGGSFLSSFLKPPSSSSSSSSLSGASNLHDMNPSGGPNHLLSGGGGGGNGGNNNANMMMMLGMKGSVKRGSSHTSLFAIDQEATKKYTRVLRPAEKVLGSGQVLKYERLVANAPKQRRIMLVTDLPRLIFIDTIGAVSRGQVDLLGESKMDLRMVRFLFS